MSRLNNITVNAANPEQALADVIKHIEETQGVCIKTVEVEWLDNSTAMKAEHYLRELRVDSSYSPRGRGC